MTANMDEVRWPTWMTSCPSWSQQTSPLCGSVHHRCSPFFEELEVEVLIHTTGQQSRAMNKQIKEGRVLLNIRGHQIKAKQTATLVASSTPAFQGRSHGTPSQGETGADTIGGPGLEVKDPVDSLEAHPVGGTRVADCSVRAGVPDAHRWRGGQV